MAKDKLWLNSSGKIILERDVAILCDECPCEPPPPSGSSSESGCVCGTADWVYSAHPLNRWDMVANNCTGGGTPVEPDYTPTGPPWTATTCCEGCDSSGSSSSGSSSSVVCCDQKPASGLTVTFTGAVGGELLDGESFLHNQTRIIDGISIRVTIEDLQDDPESPCFYRVRVFYGPPISNVLGVSYAVVSCDPLDAGSTDDTSNFPDGGGYYGLVTE